MAAELRAPFPYFGGKARVATVIWARFGDVPNYVEPFAGSLAVLLSRPHEPKVETVNDVDALLCNFWRALRAEPDAVAYHADWPVSEVDLHARHLWLLDRRADVERLIADPDWYDAKVAGWWVWGACCWIGSGWCSGRGPWRLVDGALTNGRDELPGDARQLPRLSGSQGVNRQLPHLGDAGRGVHRARRGGVELPRPHLGTAGQGVHRKLPHLGDAGRGVHRGPGGIERSRPHLADAGRGIARKRPHLMSRKGVPLDALAGDWALREYLGALAARLRRVRVVCGDWTRVLGPSVTTKLGLTGVLLDPPYAHAERDDDLYRVDEDAAAAVRAWAVAHGDDPLLRIALCGYEDGCAMPAGWTAHRWKAAGGYGSQGEGSGRANAAREVVWFSPACLPPTRLQLALPGWAGAAAGG